MLKDKIENLVKDSIKKSLDGGELGELASVPDSVAVELPKNPEHGDRAISIAMKLSKEAKINPRNIAEAIAAKLGEDTFSKVDIAGPGFINLTLNWDLLEEAISEIQSEGKNFGLISHDDRPDKSYSNLLLEYVSANPTGDLHLGHGRQAVLGSALANLLKWSGYKVSQEFYLNDAGAQITKLSNSFKQAVSINKGEMQESDYDSENNYPLDSMQEILQQSTIDNGLSTIEEYGNIAKQFFLDSHKSILKEAGVEFDKWYSEKENLHPEDKDGTNQVDKTCTKLRESGYIYDQDDAIWFKAKELGDERDRVFKKADGNYTYLAVDTAYHQDKLSRGHDKLINLWGADHHGQVPSIMAVLKALGEPAERLEVILIQMVSLTKDGQEVKMSKREGNIVTVKELIKEVGVDAFRYFLVESQANNRIVFDLELAKKQDKDNPVYYTQYAHARCCSILRNLTNEQVDQTAMDQNKSSEAQMTKAELDKLLESFKQASGLFKSFADLSGDELASTKALILCLANFPEEIKEAALVKAPYKIANYSKELATLFHQFYTHNRVINDNEELMKARLLLVSATRIVLGNALEILGISAPNKM